MFCLLSARTVMGVTGSAFTKVLNRRGSIFGSCDSLNIRQPCDHSIHLFSLLFEEKYSTIDNYKSFNTFTYKIDWELNCILSTIFRK